MRIVIILVSIFIMLCGFQLLSMAGAIATRQGSNVWTVARPEFGGALLMLILSLLIAGVAA